MLEDFAHGRPAAHRTARAGGRNQGRHQQLHVYAWEDHGASRRCVTWNNQDSMPHTATSLDGASFDSGAIIPGASWSFHL